MILAFSRLENVNGEESSGPVVMFVGYCFSHFLGFEGLR
jgi:hypothetical protein